MKPDCDPAMADRLCIFARHVFIGAVLLSLASPCANALDWHAEGWARRAVVGVQSQGSAGVDVAAVRLFHGGQTAPAAADLRIFDAAGQPVPYEVTYHHPQRQTLISFRCVDINQTYAVYFASPDAPPDPMRATTPAQPGAGPPAPGPAAGGWIPRAGVVLTTMRRPQESPNPQSVPQLAELIDQSPGRDGGAYVHNISDSFNPFGDSDFFISAYRGWMKLSAAGTYGFCTASNEASFSFIDGGELVHWPGRHTEQRGKHGEKNAEHELQAGLHYVEYYHEEVLLYQVAFLGYKPPGAKHYQGLPASLFPQPHTARVLRYESADGQPAPALRARLVDNVWPKDRPAGQYTRYRFDAHFGHDQPDAGGWQIRWSFGDGRVATGPAVEHIYLNLGDYTVTMQAAASDGRELSPQTWAMTVFPIEHLAGPFNEAKAADYKPALDG